MGWNGNLACRGHYFGGVFPAEQFANVSRKIPQLQKRLMTSEIGREDTCVHGNLQ
jgi:hypothetical protein